MGTLAQSYRRQLSFKKLATGGSVPITQNDWTGTGIKLSNEDQQLTGLDPRAGQLKSTPTSMKGSTVNWGFEPADQRPDGGWSAGWGEDATLKEDNTSYNRASNYGQAAFNAAGSAFLASQEKNRNPASNYHADGYYQTNTAAKDAMKGMSYGATIGSAVGPVGTLIGGAVGAVAGGVYGYARGSKMEKDAKQQRGTLNKAFQQSRNVEMQAQQYQNPNFSSGDRNAQMYKMGGSFKNFIANQKAIGGSMIPMSKDTTVAVGPSHAQGGIGLPNLNSELEGGETTSGDYVFSKELGFAKLHRPIAKAKGAIETRPATPERIKSLQLLQQKEEVLKGQQETLKSILNLQ